MVRLSTLNVMLLAVRPTAEPLEDQLGGIPWQICLQRFLAQYQAC